MNILIIGAQGMLGQYLAEKFAEVGQLWLKDKKDLDITDAEAVLKLLDELRPDLVINSAAYNDVDGCENNFALASAVNGQGPINLAKACANIDAKFVHYGTDYVFRGDDKNGYREDSEPDPISKYGQSKLAGESALRYCENTYIVRTSRLFGKSGRGEGVKKSFVDLMIGLAENRDSLQVVDEEYGNPTYAEDLATQTKILIQGDYEPGIYHGVNRGVCTWHEFAKEIFKIKKIDIEIIPVGADKFPRIARRPAFSELHNTKLPPNRTWQEALAEYLQ